jgi:hypothetical protein
MTAQHYFKRHEGGDLNVLCEAVLSAETIYIDGAAAMLDDEVIDSAKTIYIDGVSPTRVGEAFLTGQSVKLVFTDSSFLETRKVGENGTEVAWGFKDWSVIETRVVRKPGDGH